MNRRQLDHALRDPWATERAESDSKPLGASYLPDDITTLENAAESATRAGDVQTAIALWALALRIRQAL